MFRTTPQKRVSMTMGGDDGGGACERVTSDVDMVQCVLSHAVVNPRAFVVLGRVSKTWRQASRSQTLLLKAAASRSFLTKGAFTLLGPFV